MSAATRSARVLGGVALGVALLAGCGRGSATDDLRSMIGDIDASIVQGDAAEARDRVQRLLDETAAAEQAGDVTAQQADAIERAAERLVERLDVLEDELEPTETAPPETTEPSTAPTTGPAPTDDAEKEREKAEREAEKEREDAEPEPTEAPTTTEQTDEG